MIVWRNDTADPLNFSLLHLLQAESEHLIRVPVLARTDSSYVGHLLGRVRKGGAVCCPEHVDLPTYKAQALKSHTRVTAKAAHYTKRHMAWDLRRHNSFPKWFPFSVTHAVPLLYLSFFNFHHSTRSLEDTYILVLTVRFSEADSTAYRVQIHMPYYVAVARKIYLFR